MNHIRAAVSQAWPEKRPSLADAIRAAVAETDERRQAEKVRQVAETMRFNLGWNCEQSLRAVQQAVPNMTRDRWDELLYAADEA